MSSWVGRVLTLVLRAVAATWRTTGVERTRAALRVHAGAPLLVAFWHEQYVPLFALMQGTRARVFVGEGFRGRVIATLCERFDFEAIFLPHGDRETALERMRDALTSGVPCAAAIDGPTGPNHRAKFALVRLAIESGAHVLPLAVRMHGSIALPWRWDRRRIPLPFSQIDARVSDAMAPPARSSEAAVAGFAARIGDALDALGLRGSAVATKTVFSSDGSLSDSTRSHSSPGSSLEGEFTMPQPTAKQIMTDGVVTVSPATSLLDILRLFVEEDIHGAPVVDDGGEFVGVITTSDLLRAENDERDTVATENDYLRSLIEFAAPDGQSPPSDFQDRMAARCADEVMGKGWVAVDASTPAPEIARVLREHQIHRVWVVEDGRLVGVVSTLDLMGVLEATA